VVRWRGTVPAETEWFQESEGRGRCLLEGKSPGLRWPPGRQAPGDGSTHGF
jgi:hypothetical protein